jgi:hypothetical protein
MITVQRSHLQRYSISCLSVLLALLLGLLLQTVFKIDVSSPLFFAAVVFSSWYGGVISGLIATILLILARYYLFIPPFDLLTLNSGADALELIVFSPVALFISSLSVELQTTKQKYEANLLELQVNSRCCRETANEGVWIFDSWGKTQYVNQRLSQMLGYSIQEMVNRPIFEFMEHQAQIEIEQWLEQQKHNHQDIKQQFDLLLCCQDKSDLWVMISISPILNKHNEFSGAIATLTDITARKQTEAALRESEERYRSLVVATSQIVWTTEPDGHAGASPDWRAYTGQSGEETRDGGWLKTVHPEDRERTVQIWTQAIETKSLYDTEYRLRGADGCYRYFSVRGVPILTEEGRIRQWVGVCTDINDRKQQEKALQDSEKRFRRLVEANIFGVTFGDFTGKIHYANEAFLRMVGYEQEDLLAGQIDWNRMTPEEFLHLDAQALKELNKSGVCTPFEKEYIRKDGSRVPILIGSALLQEPYDQQQEGVAFFLDLTKRKQVEAALLQKQEWLDLSQRAAKIGSFEWNIQTNVNTWSKELEAIYGLEAGEFGGTYEEWKRWVHPDDLAKAEADIFASLTTGEFFTDFRVIWQDGSIHWLHARARVFFDDEGKPLRMVGVNVDISERKQVEVALQNSEARLRRIVESNIIGFFFGDLEGKITQANNAFLQMVGYTQQDLLAGEIDWHKMTPPEHIERTQQAAEELRKYGVCTPFEKEFYCKDGSRVFVLITSAMFEDTPELGFSCVIDITDRKQTEAALHQSELMFRTLADTMPQMFWITQPDGYHEYYNRRWYDYTGTTLEQTQGEGWHNILHPEDLERTIAVWYNSLSTGKPYDIEYRLRRAVDGEYRWHLGRAFPFKNQDGQIVKWFGSCTDIHDQKLAVEERAEAWERERTARIELEKANRLKDDFLAIVSHELRSPLNPILGWTKLLLSRKMDVAKTTQALQVIERNAKLQARLIEDLLDVSRILRGKLSLNSSQVSLVAVVEAALETVRLLAEAKSIQLLTQFAPEIGKVEGDLHRLQQVIGNLLTNAVKFTPVGGRIKICCEKIGSQAKIQITDTGKGINPDFLPHVFDRFRQADDTTTRKYGGLGLGLAIVQHIVELHGGSVEAASPGEGLGATFTVMIPLIEVASQTSQDDRLVESSPNLTGLRIVVVDDDIDTLNLLAFILEQYGAQVKAVDSADQALEAIAHSKPDFLLSDIAMPTTDGYMLIRQVRALDALAGKMLPAIALTAFAAETDHQKIIAAGFNRHLTKPVDPAELAAAIADLTKGNSHNYSRIQEAEVRSQN